jgi:hypothetical protein
MFARRKREPRGPAQRDALRALGRFLADAGYFGSQMFMASPEILHEYYLTREGRRAAAGRRRRRGFPGRRAARQGLPAAAGQAAGEDQAARDDRDAREDRGTTVPPPPDRVASRKDMAQAERWLWDQLKDLTR